MARTFKVRTDKYGVIRDADALYELLQEVVDMVACAITDKEIRDCLDLALKRASDITA